MADKAKIQEELMRIRADHKYALEEVTILERMLKETREEAEHLRQKGLELERQLTHEARLAG